MPWHAPGKLGTVLDCTCDAVGLRFVAATVLSAQFVIQDKIAHDDESEDVLRLPTRHLKALATGP